MKKQYSLLDLALSLNPKVSEVPLPLYELKFFEPLLKFTSPTSTFVPCSFKEALQGRANPTPEYFFKDPSIAIIEECFNSFCENSGGKALIPPIVHFIWLGSPPNTQVDVAVMSWKKCNPSWEMKIWTDSNLRDLLWTSPRSKVLFEQAKTWSEKSDILRFEILYQYGGVYSDTDVICLKSLDELIYSGLTFFGAIETNDIDLFLGRPLIGSAIFGAAKGSRVMKCAIDHSKTEEEAPFVQYPMRSGPGPLSKACHELLEFSFKENILLLPCSYFYPLPWEKRILSPEEMINYIGPESFALHLWGYSWKH